MQRLIWLWPVFIMMINAGYAQDISVRGIVMEEKLDGNLVPLEFANVYWQQSTKSTTTDSTGYFFIQHGTTDGEKLIFQFLGYDPDTVTVKPGQYLSVVFKEEAKVLGEVVVAHRRRTTEVSFLDPLQMQSISKEELFKAACCNLSESFETNATVDVSFTDAVTGAKEIQMLGLSGKYSLMSQEQIPAMRGLVIPFGLLYTPGPWIESIQISKGTGSVLQGYESMTGQINVELKKPTSDEKLHLNGFYNEEGRTELNLIKPFTISPMVKSSILGHYSLYPGEHDRNDDGFLDVPKGDLIVVSNRWDYHNPTSGFEGQFSLDYVRDDKESGNGFHVDSHNPYRVKLDGERFSATAKLGYVFPQKRYRSVGSQWNYTNYSTTSRIGIHNYVAEQNSFYGNWIYQSIFSDTRHQFASGLSFRHDEYNQLLDGVNYDFVETVPGTFFEYTYKPSMKITAVAGLRLDHHNIYDWLFTPRLHLRYAPNETTTLRMSGGKGFRTALPITEYLGNLASSRIWNLGELNPANDFPHGGLNMEQAWNVGASLTNEFILDYRTGTIAIDFYRTSFVERAVLDLDLSPQQMHIYNLDGKSYANTFQAEVQYELFKRFDFKTAIKLQDSKITYRDKGLREQIFTPNVRFFMNASYVSSVATYKGHWRVSATAHYTGKQRIPDTDSNPVQYQLKKYSPGYWLMNGQLTRVFKYGLEIYAGLENIFDFRQDPVIIDAHNPLGPYFDSGLIWGPIFGREWYIGFRYSLK